MEYIIHAHLLLATIAGCFWLVGKISTTNTSKPVIKDYSDQVKSIKPLSERALRGKTLFLSKCASCHNLFKSMTGPSILEFEERGPWSDRQKLYAWIRNPALFAQTDPYTRELVKKYKTMMTAFPELTDEEIDNIVEYISEARASAPTPV